jgi:hypothetical protein
MAKLLHEIWVEDADHGPLPSLVLAGPDGDVFRRGLGPSARLVRTFEAESNYEAMTIYYAYNGWGEYKLNLPEDKRPYPDDRRVRQGLLEPEPLTAEQVPQEQTTSELGQDTGDGSSRSDTPPQENDRPGQA